jgi:hypothetical protein
LFDLAGMLRMLDTVRCAPSGPNIEGRGRQGSSHSSKPPSFEVVINLMTAQSLGITNLLTLLARADEAIE